MAAKAINPIIPGFAPDPSCIRVGNTYYLVNSTFNWFPGLPIYTSTDLLSWRHVGNAINRLSQGISFAHSRTRVNPPGQWGEAMTMTGGLYAPTIRHRDGVFYVVCTNVIHDAHGIGKDKRQNFIVTSASPESDKWSDPIFFDFDGIDTCLFWDADGRSYIHGTAIQLFEIDLATGKKLSEQKTLWPGTGGVYPEGPHLIHKDAYYYLLISEGGCFEDHAITGARSHNLWGPYEACAHNPLLTARGTAEYVRNIGHSDLFQDVAGNWWAVALGIRKDPQGGRYLMGRETFLTPVDWPEGEWPRFSQIKTSPTLDGDHALPTTAAAAEAQEQPGPTFSAAPGVDFLYLRDPDLSAHRLTHTNNGAASTIALTPNPADLTQGGPDDKVTFVGKRMRVLDGGRSQATLKLPSTTATAATAAAGAAGASGAKGKGPPQGVKAGLALYKDECRFARAYCDFGTREVVFEVLNMAREIKREGRSSVAVREEKEGVEGVGGGEIAFRIDVTEGMVWFSYKLNRGGGGEEKEEERWEVAGEMDTLELTGLDFTGPVIGVFAVGDKGQGEVVFEGFSVQ